MAWSYATISQWLNVISILCLIALQLYYLNNPCDMCLYSAQISIARYICHFS